MWTFGVCAHSPNSNVTTFYIHNHNLASFVRVLETFAEAINFPPTYASLCCGVRVLRCESVAV